MIRPIIPISGSGKKKKEEPVKQAEKDLNPVEIVIKPEMTQEQ